MTTEQEILQELKELNNNIVTLSYQVRNLHELIEHMHSFLVFMSGGIFGMLVYICLSL